MSDKISILFLCTGNSCRSQMAEGLTRALKGDTIEVWSAGISAEGVDPLAIKAMKELDIDISSHASKTVEQLERTEFDYVITVCGHAHENCPCFPAKTKTLHKGFDDPPQLADAQVSAEENMKYYRRVRDEIKAFIENLPESLPE